MYVFKKFYLLIYYNRRMYLENFILKSIEWQDYKNMTHVQ